MPTTNATDWLAAAADFLTAAGTVGAVVVALLVSHRELSAAAALHRQASEREKRRAHESRIALATIFIVEIHNRAARCLLDGITWATKHVDGPQTRKRIHCAKFRPFAPTVYRAAADRLTELPSEAAHHIVRFYNALEVVDRQLSDLTENPEELFEHRTGFMPVELTSGRENSLVAARFHQTILPALEALGSLLPLVPNSEALEKQLCNSDRQYLGDAQVLSALRTDTAPLLRPALAQRLDWFKRHRSLSKYMNYAADDL